MSYLIQINLGCLPKISQTGLNLHGCKATESSCLPHHWALHAYRYSGTLDVHKQSYPFHEGCISLIPPGEKATWHFPAHAPHYYVHFFLRPSKEEPIQLPVVQSLGKNFIPFCDRLEEMIRAFHTSPRHGAIRLWPLLLDCAHLSAHETEASQILHPTIQKTLTIIRDELRTARLSTIAQIIGVSQSHLNYLFKKEFGTTLHNYIYQERVKRALHLLENSHLNIKSIAFECGFPDLQYFNKIIRRETGLSPRGYHESHHPSCAEESTKPLQQ